MNKESIKINILRTFSLHEDKVVMNFLEKCCRVDRQNCEGYPITYRPICLPVERLVVRIVRHEEVGNEPARHDVIFETSKEFPSDGVDVQINKRFEIEKQLLTRVFIKGNCVHFGQYPTEYYLDENYTFKTDNNTARTEIIFDIVNKSIQSPQGNAELLLSQIGGYPHKIQTSHEEWVAQVEEESKRNPSFAKAAEECALVKLLDPELKENIGEYYFDGLFIPMLYAYVNIPSLTHVFRNDETLEPYMEFITHKAYQTFRHPGDFLNVLETRFDRNAKNMYELIGINERWALAVDFIDKVFNPDNVRGFNKKIEEFAERLSITNSQSLRKVMEITGFSLASTPYNEFGILSYMLRNGYDIDTLHAYLSKIDEEQGLDMYRALGLLYTAFRREYFLTGNLLPIYPEYLRIKCDKQDREYMKTRDKSNDMKYDECLFIQRHRYSRKELLGTFGRYEFVCHSGSENGRHDLYWSGDSGQDVLYVKKISKRAKEHAPLHKIRLQGDNVLDLNGTRVNKDFKEAVRKWAKHHNLLTERAFGF